MNGNLINSHTEIEQLMLAMDDLGISTGDLQVDIFKKSLDFKYNPWKLT